MSTVHPKPRLIDDLVPIILESNDHWWPRDLLRLAQVSLAWLGPARRRLYASPTLHSFRACSQFARALSNNSSLTPLVKGVDLRPMLGDSTIPLGPKESTGIRFILGLEGLRFIALGGSLSVRAERFLHSLGDTYAVEDLHIDGSLMTQMESLTSNSYYPSLEWDESLAFKFHNLRKLRLTNIELDIIYPTIPYQLQIGELTLNNVTVMSGFISHLLHETPSLEHLSVLTKSASEFDEQIKLVLSVCAVRVLEYEVQTDLPSHSAIFDSNSHLPSVHCLRLNGVHVDMETLTHIIEGCRNLQELSIGGRMANIQPADWVTFIESGALSSLCRIGLPWGTNQPPFVQWPESMCDAISRAAALRDIHILADPRYRVAH